ncbi:MAG: hypothetical protein WCP10_12725 [Desulfuromonadales bacterium]
MITETAENILEWLKTDPPLNELQSKYPEIWNDVQRDIATIVNSGTTAELQAYLKHSSALGAQLTRKLRASRGDKKVLEATLRQIVSNRMAQIAVRQHCIAEATGIEKGKVRFNRLNGYVAQKLLFRDGLERKPASLFWFRLLWPLVWQKRLLMPLVQPEGIYCFYTRELVRELAGMIGARNCLEIAAGDGSLSRFLQQRGVRITATDDYSWQHQVAYPDFVVKQEAREALRLRAPEVVVCSWPPANNSFEGQVFRTKSVQLYIVIGSRHRFAAGNWDEYSRQSAFDFAEEQRLSGLVLPPELDSAVYIFRRKADT